MTTLRPHHARVGQSRHHGRQALGLLAALSLVAALVSGCAGAGASTATTLRSAVGVLVTSAGVTSSGRAGQTLRPGDVVTTGPRGAAVLDTGGRLAWLAADSAFTVRDGTTETLDRGSVLVDSRSGPPVTVRVGSLTVSPQSGSAVRVESTFALRIGVVVGSAQVDSPGRAVTVPALRQLLATALALPMGPLPPLQLRDDQAEKSVAPGLVSDDEYLLAEGRELDSGAQPATALLTAAYRVVPSFVVASGEPASESLLPLLIAQSAGGNRGLPARYARVSRLREQGGSWGVVAHLVGASALRTTPELARLLLAAGPATTGSGTGAAVGNAATVAAGSTPVPVAPPGGTGGGTTGTGGGTGTTGGTSGSGAGSGGGGPVPSPSPSPGSLVTTVQSLLPSLPASALPSVSLSLP